MARRRGDFPPKRFQSSCLEPVSKKGDRFLSTAYRYYGGIIVRWSSEWRGIAAARTSHTFSFVVQHIYQLGYRVVEFNVANARRGSS